MRRIVTSRNRSSSLRIYDSTEKALRNKLFKNPQDVNVRAQLALHLLETRKPKVALRHAEAAVRDGPAEPGGFYVLARILKETGSLVRAEATARKTLRLAPDDADNWNLLAGIYLEMNKCSDAMEALNHGLARDRDHVACLNTRARVLIRMNRIDEAVSTLRSAIGREPENAVSHANLGMAHLERGEIEDALHAFQQALQLNPKLECARVGLLSALKARNPFIRLMINLFSRLLKIYHSTNKGKDLIQWMFYSFLILKALESKYPTLILISCILIVVNMMLIWVAEPLLHLVLFTSREGRLLLETRQLLTALGVGICLVLALAVTLSGLLLERNELYFIAMGPVMLILPVAGVFACSSEKYRLWLVGLVLNGMVVLAALCLCVTHLEVARFLTGAAMAIAFLIKMLTDKYR